MQPNTANTNSWRPFYTGIIVFLALNLLTMVLSYQRYLLFRDADQRKVIDEANSAKERLQNALSHSISTTYTLSFLVQKYGIPQDFDAIAKKLLENNKYIDAVQLVPGGVISNTYPLKGNEGAIGYNILRDSARNAGAFTAIEKKELFFAGPQKLKQGGVGVIGRLPIFINDKFWGFSAVIIRLPTLLKAAGIDSSRQDEFDYQLSKINNETGLEEFFIPNNTVTDDEYSVPINVNNTEWKLYVTLSHYTALTNVMFIAVLGFLISFIGAVFAWFITRQPEVLKQMVKERTEQLQNTQANYKTTMERISDAFIALDKDLRFTYVNPRAAEIMGFSAEWLMGKKYEEVFPREQGNKTYQTYLDAVAQQKPLHIEEYYEPYDRWFENFLYPSANGVTLYFKDITKRKRAEEEILNAYKEKETVMNRINDGMISVDNNWRYTFLNDAALSTHPEGREATLGKVIWDVHPEMEGTAFKAGYLEAMATQKVVEIEDYYAHFNAWFYVKVYPSPDGLTLIFRDVTEKKKIENALKLSEQRYRQLIQELPEAVYTCDSKGKIQLYNKAAVQLWGSEPDPDREFWGDEVKIMNKNGEVLTPDQYPIVVCLREKRPIYGEELIVERGDGSRKYLLGHPSPLFNEQGELTGAVNVIIDITARRKAENAVINEKNLSDFIINSLPGAFYLYDKTGKFLRWNKNFETVSGYTSVEVSQMHPLDFFHENEKQLLSSRIAEVFEKGFSDVEANLYTKNKQLIPYYFNGSAVELEGQGYLIGMGIDISERKMAEEEIKQSQMELRRLSAHLQTVREEERAAISREIHDQLGQQLTGLKMDISWIAKKVTAENEDLQNRIKEMIGLIDETVVTVRRISSNLRPGILDDLGLIAALEWQSSEFEKRTSISCKLAYSDGEIYLERDMATAIFRVYQETLTNVMRHAHATEVNTRLEKTSHEIILSITDNGKGFDANDTKNKKTLGLIGMKERALMFNGEMNIESTPGKGTTVTLKIPITIAVNDLVK